MNKSKIRNRFSSRESHAIINTGESATKQSFKDEADINQITARYLKTGVLGNPNATRQAQFGDYTSMDFMEMRNLIADVDQLFNSLPSRIRKRFNNDTYQLIRWIENPDNNEEAIKLGLKEPPQKDFDDNPFIDENQMDIVEESKKGTSTEAPNQAEKPKPNTNP